MPYSRIPEMLPLFLAAIELPIHVLVNATFDFEIIL